MEEKGERERICVTGAGVYVALMEPAIMGTRNVLNACLKVNVKKVVVVSSIGAVVVNLNWPMDQVMDERCWTGTECSKSIELWYCIAKTMAESEALDFAKRTKLNIITVCPSLVVGPMLQSTWNTSSFYLLNFLEGFHQCCISESANTHLMYPESDFFFPILAVNLVQNVSFLCLICNHEPHLIFPCCQNREF
ncbi:cinnamoyl-CoA reductase 1-like [Syzygium oleosum]|uniref:cinnamoyl-CoA reductase 1-like n=1 Tax=Syzygium oleosum TaxID=219896 RepID=UPI0024B89853|nr:cinnamoyl-CoA reductase 1-like [Syzygium oleosum]